jgi:hypothetical protein
MRTLSRRIRSRTSFFWTARYAAEISFSRPCEGLALAGQVGLEDLLSLVELGLAVLLAGDREQLAQLVGGRRLDGVVRVRLVVQEDRELLHLFRGGAGELLLRAAQGRDRLLGGLQTGGHDLLGRRLLALVLDEVPRRIRGLGLDHHDRDVVVGHRRRAGRSAPRPPCRRSSARCR